MAWVTADEVITSAYYRFGETKVPTATNEKVRMLDWIGDAVSILHDEYFFSWTKKTVTITLNAGIAAINASTSPTPLPTEINKIFKLLLNGNKLDQLTEPTLDRTDNWQSLNGFTFYETQTTPEIIIYPTPTTSSTVYIMYYARPVSPSGTAASLLLLPQDKHVIASYVAAQLFSIRGKFGSARNQMEYFNQGIRKIVARENKKRFIEDSHYQDTPELIYLHDEE